MVRQCLQLRFARGTMAQVRANARSTTKEIGTGTIVTCAVSLSLSLSLSLYLSLSRRKRTWTPVRIALHKSSCSPAGGSHPRRGASCCCTLRRLRPRRSQHNALRGDSMLIGMAGRDPGQPTCRKPVAYASPALNTTIRVPAVEARCRPTAPVNGQRSQSSAA